MKKTDLLFSRLASIIVSVSALHSAWAAVPETITIQGTLKAPGGGPLTGTYFCAVRIWDASVDGNLLANSGGTTTFSNSGRFSLALQLEDVFVPPDQAWYDLGVDTDNDGIEEAEFFPNRVRFHSVPFARVAADSQRLEGVAGAEYTTDAELLSGLAGKADAGHLHDDRYQTLGLNPLQLALQRWYPINRKTRTFPVGASPSGLAFDGENIWVANYNGSSVSVLRASDGAPVGTYPVGISPEALAYDGDSMWVVDRDSDKAFILRARDGTVLGFRDTGPGPTDIVYDGTRIWTANSFDSTLSSEALANGVSPTTGTVLVSANPERLAFDGRNVWVTCYASGTIMVIDATGSFNQVFPPISVPPPLDIAFDGARMWVTNLITDTVTVIGALNGEVVKTLTTVDGVGDKPTALAFDGANMWVVNEDDDTVSIFRTADFSLVGKVPVGDRPLGIAFDGANMWVTNNNDGTVSKL
jgi:DNA-binding beta-propeller fold protein YncE